MAFYRIFIFSMFYFGLKAQDSEQNIPPDFDLNITETIEKYGYPAEIHEITTADGYIIDIFRIPHGKGGSGINKKPIFLMHGLFGQAENYILAGMCNASLAYHLADNGFDVWLGNSRGNQHGQRHISLNPNNRSFWNFSWHEIGMNDIPASIDYILEKRKMKKLYYIGHSQGGTVFYVMTSMKPEYQEKIIMASLLSPAAFMDHFHDKLMINLLNILLAVENFADILYAFPPHPLQFFELTSSLCKTEIFEKMCLNIYNVFVRGDYKEFRKEILPVGLKYFPSVSFRQIKHYIQVSKSGFFRQWDFGKKKNLKIYGTPVPPDYPISTIKVPIAVYYSEADNIVDWKDIEHTMDLLPNVVRRYLIPKPNFTHIDFIYAASKKWLTIPVLEFVKKFDNGL